MQKELDEVAQLHKVSLRKPARDVSKVSFAVQRNSRLEPPNKLKETWMTSDKTENACYRLGRVFSSFFDFAALAANNKGNGSCKTRSEINNVCA